MATTHNQDYFDRLLRRGPYNVRLSNLRDDELQQIVRDERKRRAVMPTVDDSEELLELAEEAKGELGVRYPKQNAGMELK
jgi:hypothetical protein